jgi:flagellar biosynthesis anti-sigma factor FlgM
LKIDSSSSASHIDLASRRRAPRDAAPPQAARPEASADAIEISPQARRVVQFPNASERSRAELVARLRQEVDAGTYRPDADAIAQRIAERLNHQT